MKYYRSILPLLILALLQMPVALAQSDGSIFGTVTDANGVVIANATVTVRATGATATITVKTDLRGRFEFKDLPPGSFTITIASSGFVQLKRENIVVEPGKSAEVSAQLEIAPVDTSVSVNIAPVKANTDAGYQRLRTASTPPDSFGGDFATVNNLVLKRDAGIFTLRSGEIYFLAPVDGRTVGAVFLGDGEFHLEPPTDVEKKSLAIFTEKPDITEPFTQLVLRFTDDTRAELKASPSATFARTGSQAGRARDLFREKEELFRKEFQANMDLRILCDLYAPPRPGFFLAMIGGKRFNKLIYHVDPLGLPEVYPEQVDLTSYGDSDGGIWTAFHMEDEYRKGTANSSQDRRFYDISRHDLDLVIKGTKFTATDKVTYSPLVNGQRVLPFDLYRTLRVSRVQDETGRDLDFIQQGKDDDADFAVILPTAGEAGRSYKLSIEYAGDEALFDSGSGNYFLRPRSTWYPNNFLSVFGDRALFDINFHFPKGNMLVGVGALAEPEKIEGNTTTAHWTSGQTELQVAGFNYGRFKRKAEDDPGSGYGIEYYANLELPNEVKALQMRIEQAEAQGQLTGTTLGAMTTTTMANSAIADTKNSMLIYNAYFGKLPFTRIAMTQQPAAGFGQAWPTLVYMPFTAFLDATIRTQLFGIGGGTDSFWTYVGPHEISHQWWGHAVGWSSYHDQWMSEGFAEFSTSLYAQFVRHDLAKFNALWDQQRELITQSSPQTRGRKPYTVGPVTQGYRLNNGKTGNVARAMIYPKGAYILQMIRMLMMDHRNGGGDNQFKLMMKDFVQSHLNQNASTEDFKAIVEKYMTPGMDVDKNKSMNWFFDEWIYGTDVPAYKFDYQITKTPDGKPAIKGTITQSGVSKSFVMAVPIYLDFGKGWSHLGSVVLAGNTTFELPLVTLPAGMNLKRATLCAMSDVLYTSLDVNKR